MTGREPLPNPIVFVSHAGADNDRFARDFAKRLRDRGIDVWFDQWELLPGDSLVDKIFEEGLKHAEAVIVILSQASLASAWVREELNAAVVNRIERQTKLIPVIIDDVDPPEALRAVRHIRIRDLKAYDTELDEIVRAVLGDRNRPPLGALPGYSEIVSLADLHGSDTLVLKTACELAIETDSELVESEAVLARVSEQGLTEAALLESLQILEGRGYLEVHQTMASGIDGMSAFTLSPWGLDLYSEGFSDREGMHSVVIAGLVNVEGGMTTDRELADQSGVHRLLVEAVLDLLQGQGLIQYSKLTGPVTHVHWVSPELRRALQ